MDPIKLQRMAYAIRALTKSTHPAASQPVEPHQSTPLQPLQPDYSLEGLKAALFPRLATLSLSDADSRVLAATILSQEVLCWQYGQQIVNHPDFYVVIEQLSQQLLSHPHLAEQFEDILVHVQPIHHD